MPIIRSWHTQTTGHEGLKRKFARWLFGRNCYCLPVSVCAWSGLKKWAPHLKGEVFYNSLKLNGLTGECLSNKTRTNCEVCGSESLGCRVKVCKRVVGMLGRNATVKDWPSFNAVGTSVCEQFKEVSFWGVGVTEEEAFTNFGDASKVIEWKGPRANGREWIGKMDVFVLTSTHEEMPTVVLEAFAEKTAICGFIPEGGMVEILSFSSGPLKEVFIHDRDTERLAGIVLSLLKDEGKRKAVIEDGWQILANHFDAEKNCRGQLMDIYRRAMS